MVGGLERRISVGDLTLALLPAGDVFLNEPDHIYELLFFHLQMISLLELLWSYREQESK